VAGPARVRLRVERGAITNVRVGVGPAPSRDEGTTDLGAVPSPEAAAFFLALADSADGEVGRHAIVAAVLADSVSVWPRLLAIATDTARVSHRTRHDATFWVGRFAAAKLSGNGEDLAAADNDGDEGDDARGAAVFALSQLRGHAGVEPLLQVARTNRDPAVRRKAIFWLGESGDPRALVLFREILRGG
jgi:HEAT repeat protein